MILALLVVLTPLELAAMIWHYAGYFSGRYDPKPLTPCHDTSSVTDTSQRKDPES